MRGSDQVVGEFVSPVTLAQASILGSDWPMIEKLGLVLHARLRAASASAGRRSSTASKIFV